jgi:uncharacterized protein YeaO (DUF488 family)
MPVRIRASNVKLKRAYEPPREADGTRILVDRLWPRGIRKADAAIDKWVKELAPSTKLRQWFGHDSARWQEFRRRYAKELREHARQLEQLRVLARNGPITLVFSARDEMHNDAVALRDFLLRRQITRKSKTVKSKS